MGELDKFGITLLGGGQETPYSPTYRAQKSQGCFGIDDDNNLHTGLTLTTFHPKEFLQENDLLGEEITNIGAEAHIILPDGGLIEGHIYEASAINISTDWETGVIDDYDIELIDITASEGNDSEEHF